MSAIPASTKRLLTLTDTQGLLLAEFDFFAEQQVLWVRWHGHLTAPSVVEATQAGITVRQHGLAQRRLLSDESQASGEWTEALPWMHYEWLPDAVAHGLRAIAFVVSPYSRVQPSNLDFILEVKRTIDIGFFDTTADAWRWLLRHG